MNPQNRTPLFKTKFLLNLIFVTLALSLGTTARASSIDLKTAESKVEFLAIGKPSAIKIRGETKTDKIKEPLTGKLQIVDNGLTGTAQFQLDALDTGIESRNGHMKEKYLETKKFPTSTIKILTMKLPADEPGKEVSLEGIAFTGSLNLHGQEKPIKGVANYEKKDSKTNLSFLFEISVTDFGIEIPSYLGIKVTDAVKITTKVSGIFN